ncbi:hypothetical protein EXIGLDRAFT_836171 [Exidia glandulosa HHB12029]|uniref:Protein kinase domain-containing protein n=1 Tax=Exidia glandulosa HHB12029 TaxID=1314781 RepID=A0A165I2X8_EXIGL|nr:hypothetical protein EXIGLDRAFT_836171 [Exidia glandulosa HHB12029]
MDIDSPNQLPVLHVRLKSQLHVGPNAVTRDGLIKDVDERVVVKTFPAGQRAFALDEARLITLAECGDLVPAILGIFYHGDNDSETHVVFKWCGTAPKTFCDLPLTDKLLIKNAFEKLHEEGIWHGDVEPRNVVKDAATGKWTVVDFGEATTHICEGPTCSELVQLEKDLSF